MTQLYCHTFNRASSQNKPAIVLLHGFLGDSSDWQILADSLIQKLGNSIGIYALDLPGHGQSSHISLNSSEKSSENGFDYCCKLISCTLAAHNIQHYILLGYSLGGRIALHHVLYQALYHACTQTKGVTGLILESSHFGLVNENEKLVRIKNDQNWAQQFKRLPITEVLASWYQQPVFNSLTEPQITQLIAKRKLLNTETVANMLIATSLAKQNYLAETFAKAQAQTHLKGYYLYGEKDPKFKALAGQYQQICPSLNTIEIANAGHNIHFENTDVFSNKIIDIYQQLNQI